MEQNEKRCATLVIDIGTSSARLLVIDRKGVIYTKFQKNYPLYVLNESTAIQNPEEVMEKIWEIILILALAGMAFILRLDRKKEKETDETNSKK